MSKNKASTQYSIVSPFAEVGECLITQNKLLRATVELEKGQVITDFGHQEILPQPNYLTVQIGEREHIMLSPEFLQYINHGCEPNVFFDTEKLTLSALKKIEIGEELKFFYPSTEWSMERAFRCNCQSKNCLGYIQGAAHLPLDVLTHYRLSSFIRRKVAV
ncbi:SET domain-containing protein-lysine N-methyltransferase [Oscillatoria sp. FACHB-1406]|uniref:SET domain-containing protein-lysine N-methyltransferase n=1 Tax=Oscillatoria sp. FACHB-1406 TaxID=2692846 RepID=UPI0016865DFB|nr:SET domain-containing protein-lysine N-methyltransferase [Oscillatoria sp. FACHB-1406]MBD2580231.1 SET domain-containing protein-lysine N-methyltransferase [Oscillatoria sp. FACHB-1406]